MLGLLNMVEVRNLANLSSYRKFRQNEVLCSQVIANDDREMIGTQQMFRILMNWHVYASRDDCNFSKGYKA